MKLRTNMTSIRLAGEIGESRMRVTFGIGSQDDAR
jgi:hypothetical protein